MANKKPLVLTNGKPEQIQSGDVIDPAFYSATGGSSNSGSTLVNFSSLAYEASATVTGQSAILTTSKVIASIYCNTDDVYAQDWKAIVVRNIVAGVGFLIVVKSDLGRFKGLVQVNWSWI